MIDDYLVWLDILDQAEEDYTGLWELVWSLNRLFPKETKKQKILTAAGVLQKMIGDGEVELFRTSDNGKRFNLIDPGPTGAILQRETAWSPPAQTTDSVLVIACTQAGQRRYEGIAAEEYERLKRARET